MSEKLIGNFKKCNNMYNKKLNGVLISDDILNDARLKFKEKVILAIIHSYTDKGLEYSEKNDFLAQKLSISTRYVRYSIAKLISLKLIEQTGFDGRRRCLKAL